MSAVESKAISPFKGLAAFADSELDALLFFGREREREVLLANLLAARLTILYGESGVGKSSLLAAAVVRDLRETVDAPVVVRSAWSGGLESVLADFGDGEGYLILDQFEEYFLYHDDDSALLDELPELLSTSRVNVLISLREDALARLDVFKARIPTVFANQVRLEHLDPQQARAAILGPLTRWRDLYGEHVDAEPALVEAVIAEVAVDGGRVEAPYLQLVVERVWHAERDAGSNVLRRETLERLGGASSIVRDQFAGSLESLSASEQDVAAAMFEHLVTPTGTKIALRAADLTEYARVPQPVVLRVLDRLTRDRLVRSVEGSDRFEIFHDVLAEPISAWRLERQLAAARRQQRRLVAIAVASLLALAVVAGLAVWAFSERGTARRQARHAQARELDARALQGLSTDANKSVRLALTALWLEPGGSTESVLRQALLSDRLRLVRHVGVDVHDAAVSPDGKLVAVALAGRRVQLLDARNRRLVRAIRTHRVVDAVGFIDGGRTLVAASGEGRVEEWGTATGAPVDVPKGVRAARTPDGGLALVAVRGALAHVLAHARRLTTSDGRRVAAIVTMPDGHQRAQLFDDGRLVRVLPQIGVADVAFSRDGTHLATAGQDGFTNIWNGRTGALVWSLADAKSGAETVAFSPDGTSLASGGEDSGVRIWDVAKGTRTFLLFGHTNPVIRVAWSPDGAVVASAGVDGTTLLWRMRGLAGAGSLAGTLTGSTGAVDALAFTPDSTGLVTGGADGTVRIWDAAPDEQLQVVGRAHGPALAAQWSGAGVVGLWPHALRSFAPSGTPLRTLGGSFTALAASPTSPLVAVGTSEGDTELWNARTGDVLRDERGSARVTAVAIGIARVASGAADGTVRVVGRWHARQPGPVVAAAFSPDGRLLATAGRSGALLWDVATGKRLFAYAADEGATRVAFSPDGRLLAVAGRDGTARLWFTRTGRLFRVLRGHTKALTDIVFSADGRLVATSGADADVRLWSVAKGTHYVLQRRAFGPVAAVALDPTGHWVAGAAPVSAIVWNGVSGRQLFYVRGHTALLTSISFAPRGEMLLTSSRDGTIRTYDCEVCADRSALVHLAEVRLAQTR